MCAPGRMAYPVGAVAAQASKIDAAKAASTNPRVRLQM